MPLKGKEKEKEKEKEKVQEKKKLPPRPPSILHSRRMRTNRRQQLSMNQRSIIGRKSTLWKINHPLAVGKSVVL